MGGRGSSKLRTSRTVRENGPESVRQCLQAYADRGVFRGFTERPARAGRVNFRFSWLARTPFDLVYEPATGTFTFVNVFPNVGARTPLGGRLKTFVKGRASSRLPEHRRVNPRRAGVRAYIQRGDLRLQVIAKRGHHAYGANRVVNLVHEVYLHLHSYEPEYLWANYGLAQD